MEIELIKTTIEANIHHFLAAITKEYDGDKQAVVIIQTYVKTGKISDTDDVVLRTQVMDSLKIVGIGIPFALIPGASILMPIILKVAAKHNINLIPTAFEGS